jgi:hypothetical protein
MLCSHFGYCDEIEFANQQWDNFKQGDGAVQPYIQMFESAALRIPDLTVKEKERKFKYSLNDGIQAKLQEDFGTRACHFANCRKQR